MSSSRFPQSHREAHLLSYSKSGLSQSEYCRAQGIKISTFSGWLRRSKSKPPSNRLTPVLLSESISSKQANVHLPNGIDLSISLETSNEFYDLVRGLKQC